MQKELAIKTEVTGKGKTYTAILNILRALALLEMLYYAFFGAGAFGSFGRGFSPLGVGCNLGFLAISFIPGWFTEHSTLQFPLWWQVFFCVFVYSSMCLGTAIGFYDIFPWWDIYLHGTSGAILCAGWYYVYTALVGGQVKSPFAAALFAFGMTMATGVLWEFYEFFGDMVLGQNMQRGMLFTEDMAAHVNRFGRFVDPGLVDTMKDMFMNTVGAGAGALCIWFTREKK